MFVFILQAALLLAIAYILGAVFGCLLRTQFNKRPERPVMRSPVAAVEPGSGAASEAVEQAVAAEPPARKPAARKVADRKAPAAGKATAAAGTAPDDLKQIRGIGRQIEAKLNTAGITRFDQIASWTKKDAVQWGEKLSFAGRIEREGWVAQAKKLARGEKTDFAKRVAKREVATSKAAPKAGGKS